MLDTIPDTRDTIANEVGIVPACMILCFYRFYKNLNNLKTLCQLVNSFSEEK